MRARADVAEAVPLVWSPTTKYTRRISKFPPLTKRLSHVVKLVEIPDGFSFDFLRLL